MKWIQYKMIKTYNNGKEENQTVRAEYCPKNLEIAKSREHNGEITIEDDGQPEPSPSETEQLRSDVNELQEALNMILSGVTE